MCTESFIFFSAILLYFHRVCDYLRTPLVKILLDFGVIH